MKPGTFLLCFVWVFAVGIAAHYLGAGVVVQTLAQVGGGLVFLVGGVAMISRRHR